jgi:hypothetical protein
LDPSTREEEEKVRAESMPGKGKRRSARLLKLEEQKNDDEVDACRLDPLQIIRNTISGAVRGKGKRNGEIQVKLIIRSFGFFVSLCLHILASWVMYKFGSCTSFSRSCREKLRLAKRSTRRILVR